VQQMQPGWRDHGSSQDGEYLRGNELSDREEREARGGVLPAAYRYILGPTPKCLPSDRLAAKIYLGKIQQAIDMGGWTRSENKRLQKMRHKWKKRAGGNDPRFNILGNRSTGMRKLETANVRDRQVMQDMMDILTKSGRRSGD